MDRNKLYEIIDEYWRDFNDKKYLKGICHPSIPIIWFGNIDKYFNSKIRTITVGLNPSNNEFMDNNIKKLSFRIENANIFLNKNYLNNKEKDMLIDSYNNYFNNNPYTKWFSWNDKKIMRFINCKGGYDVGYNANYDKLNHINAAIHVDCCSAIATDPTISGLKRKYNKTYKILPNMDLFVRFINFLKPDVILFSSNYNIFKQFMQKYCKNDRLKPFYGDSDNYPKKKGKLNAFIVKDKLLIHGRNMGTLFSPIKDEDKIKFFNNIFKEDKLDKN